MTFTFSSSLDIRDVSVARMMRLFGALAPLAALIALLLTTAACGGGISPLEEDVIPGIETEPPGVVFCRPSDLSGGETCRRVHHEQGPYWEDDQILPGPHGRDGALVRVEIWSLPLVCAAGRNGTAYRRYYDADGDGRGRLVASHDLCEGEYERPRIGERVPIDVTGPYPLEDGRNGHYFWVWWGQEAHAITVGQRSTFLPVVSAYRVEGTTGCIGDRGRRRGPAIKVYIDYDVDGDGEPDLWTDWERDWFCLP